MRRNLFAPRIAFSMLVLALLLTSVTTVVAVFTRPELPGQSGSLPVKAPNLPEFLQKAQAGGSLPVIVMLNVPFQSESQLSSAVAVDTQRAILLQTQDALLARLPGYAPASVKKYHFIPAIALSVDAAGLAALAADPQVANIEEDQLDRVELAQSVPFIGAPGVWISGYTGSGQVVAILDTGVDKNHTFLTGKVKAEACYSSKNATYGSTSICPGGANSSTAGNSAMPYLSGVCPANGCDHGTHVAGIAAGKDPEGLGFNGVAKGANLIAIQVFARFDSTAKCGSSTPCVLSYTSDQVLGLQHVYDLRTSYAIASVNMSLGGGHYTTQSACDADNAARKAAIDNLRSAGIAVIIASGNNGITDGMASPACISSAISVGSTGDGSGGATVDTISSFSNSVSFLSLLAPGEWITSSVPGGLENNYETWAGTSMATPHVAGAWAVLKSKFPTATVDQILNALKTSGNPITDSRNGVVTPRIRLDMAANQTYSISGQVTKGTVGGPGLAGVTINAGGGHTTTTDSSGNYILSGLQGTYTLIPSLGANVFVPAASTPVTVSSDQTGINFVAQTYSISGMVAVGSSGGPALSGVTMTADASHTVTTDGSGSYSLSGLLAGAYPVTPAKTEYTFNPTKISVIVGPNRIGINFIATQKTYTISGQITPAINGVSLSDGAGHTAATISGGNYTFSGLVAGMYTITPTLAAHSFNPVSAQVTVGPNKTGINFTDIPGFTASGEITVGSESSPGLAGVTVTANATYTATTDANGNYTVVGLAAGSYTLTPFLAEFSFSPLSAPVTVGANKTDINFIATQFTYTVSGKVTVGSGPGSPGLAGVTVSDGAGHTATTDDSGDYTLSGLVKGSYTISLSKPKYTFSPGGMPVSVGPSLPGINFTGTLLPFDMFLPLIK